MWTDIPCEAIERGSPDIRRGYSTLVVSLHFEIVF